jgi:hypothetical protein
MRRFFFLIVFLMFAFSVGPAGAAPANADVSSCSAVLYSDAELLQALPTRLRPILESSHFHRLVGSRDAAWAGFHQALDRGLATEGKDFVAKIEDLDFSMRFRRSRKGALELWIAPFDRKMNGFGFLDFVGAELAWIAKARAAGKLAGGLKIYGRDLESRRLVDLLQSIGFERSRWPGPQCYLYSLAGGISGILGGKLFFAWREDRESDAAALGKPHSIEEERRRLSRDIFYGSTGGVGITSVLACMGKTGRNYSIEFDPKSP